MKKQKKKENYEKSYSFTVPELKYLNKKQQKDKRYRDGIE